ncbi:MAG: tRNA glutamyl-Q(34) synthetase GluQRS [Acidobacteriia bacterium]|nr:tRNA glutamyl-Q(34) synthetase GluQRS [Terriglobia bacterium]
MQDYRGRLAPSPTGHLHVGHARTFWIAYERARAAGGVLVLRNEDLDPQRSKAEYARAFIEELRWFGIEWREGPDLGGPFAPYSQSERSDWYVHAWRKLYQGGWIYPCTCSRKDLAEAAQAPHESNDEPMYSGKCRGQKLQVDRPTGVNWRFRVPDGRVVRFRDGAQGEQQYTAGKDFGDFVVWRRDDVPAYQLAVVADDCAMRITEVVRGCDLLKSTARQILLCEALGIAPPAYYHCDLLVDERGERLAKRTDALSLRALRAKGIRPEQIRENWLGLRIAGDAKT